MTHPGNLCPDDALDLEQVRAACPELDATYRHVRAFATMMRDLRGDRLPAWSGAISEEDLPQLHRSARRLCYDLDAIVAGLSVPRTPDKSRDKHTSKLTPIG
ncbi:MAG: hypothetical protein HOZ81_44530 [Streptomyces sp.]|nr:hypothetical protein [Streptomyces sp.]NUP44250.1 hypothetical protein [Streptomyces sp.]